MLVKMKKWLVIGNIQMMPLGAVLSAIELEKNTVGQENIIHIVKRNNIIKAMLKNIAFLDVYAKFSLKGVRMQRLKKVFLFILGIVIIPVILGKFLSWIVGCEDYQGINFFGLVFFLIYVIFPVLYRGKIREKIPNRYLFYVLLYLLFAALFVWIYL